jgi:MFS family permease
MIRDLDVSLSQGAAINAGLFAGSIMGILTFSLAMPRVPAKWALTGGTALLGTGLIAAGGIAHNLWALSLAYVVVGFAYAISNALCWIWLLDHAREDFAASGLNLILFFSLGALVVPPTLGKALEAGAGWRWILVVEGGIALIIAAISTLLPVRDVARRPRIRSSHFQEVFSHDPRLLAGILCAGFLYGGTEAIANFWLPKFQIDVFIAAEATAGFSLTLFWLGMVMGRLGFLPLVRRYSSARLLLLCSGSFAVFLVATAFAPTQGASLAVSFGAGLGASASYGIIASYSRRFPERLSWTVSCLFIFSGTAGGLVLPCFVGPLAEAAGFRVALAMTAVPAVAYGLLAIPIYARTERALVVSPLAPVTPGARPTE